MIPSLIITFRETSEVALVVGIIMGYLVRSKQTEYNNVVYVAVVSGILASIIGAFLFTEIAGGFTGRAETIFEGVTMLFGALLLTTMILWMMRQKHMVAQLQQRVAADVAKARKFSLFS